LDQVDCLVVAALLLSGDTEEVQGVGLTRVALQNLVIEAAGIRQPAGLMERHRLTQEIDDASLRGVIHEAWRRRRK
jgi:hypothetical protein